MRVTGNTLKQQAKWRDKIRKVRFRGLLEISSDVL